MTRLIDADALIEKYTVVIRKDADEKLKTEIAVLLKDIEEQPTIDAEPVRHGKWIRQTDTRFGEMLNDILICSECNVAFSTVKMIRRSYCPNCGARMDAERKEE